MNKILIVDAYDAIRIKLVILQLPVYAKFAVSPY